MINKLTDAQLQVIRTMRAENHPLRIIADELGFTENQLTHLIRNTGGSDVLGLSVHPPGKRKGAVRARLGDAVYREYLTDVLERGMKPATAATKYGLRVAQVWSTRRNYGLSTTSLTRRGRNAPRGMQQDVLDAISAISAKHRVSHSYVAFWVTRHWWTSQRNVEFTQRIKELVERPDTDQSPDTPPESD